MRLLVKCSVFCVMVAGLLSAQHGGGSNAGGGHHGGGGFSGGASHAPAGAGNSAYHMFQPASGFTGINKPGILYPTPLGLQSSPSGFTGIERGSYRNEIHPGGSPPTLGNRPIRGEGGGERINRLSGRNRLYVNPYYPFWGFGSGFDNGFYDQPTYYSAQPEQYAPPEQYTPSVSGPDPYADAPANYYPPIPYQGAPNAMQQQPQQPDPPRAPTVLILKNGGKVEVQSYAIINGVFWDFTKENSKRIPLANIDEAASAKATEAAGGSFPEESFATNPK